MSLNGMFSRDSQVSNLKSDYKVVLNGRDVTEYALSNFSIDDTTARLYHTFEGGFIVGMEQGRRANLKVDVGQKIELYYKEKKLFDGIIFLATYNEDYTVSFKAYDYGIYYTKNYVNKTFKNVTADGIIKAIVGDSGLPLGSVASTGYVFPEYVAEDKSISDVVYDVLENSEAQTGKTYYPMLRNKKLNISLYEKPKKPIVFSGDKDILSVSNERSIEDLANSIIVRGGNQDNPFTATTSDSESIRKYGRMQLLESVDEKANASHARDRASKLLEKHKNPKREVSLTVIGDFNVRAGTMITIKDERVGASGNFVATEVSHNVNMSEHTMDLTLKEV